MSEFVTGKGVTLTLSELAPPLIERVAAKIEMEYRERGQLIDPPTYSLKTVAGELQEFKMTENNLHPTDENEAELRQARWAEYQDATIRLLEDQQEARVKFQLTYGVSFAMPGDDRWQKLVKAAGIEIPEDEDDKRFVCLWYTLLTPFEVQQILAELALLAYGKAVSSEEVQSFRDSMEDSVRRTARDTIAGALQSVDDATPADE